MSGYTPSEEEMREYVANGGEYRPWETPDAAEEAARVAAFDRFLADDRRKTAARAWAEGQLSGAYWGAPTGTEFDDFDPPSRNPYEKGATDDQS